MQFIKARPVEIDHTSEVCVMRCWVEMLFSTFYYTHHSCMCTCILQEENLLLWLRMFPVATKLVPFW